MMNVFYNFLFWRNKVFIYINAIKSLLIKLKESMLNTKEMNRTARTSKISLSGIVCCIRELNS